jgi:glycosyltransferase involved in cell wall biosynthesis
MTGSHKIAHMLPGTGFRLAVIVDRYPCVSESFIRRELADLVSHGFTLAIVTCSPAQQCDTWVKHELPAKIFRPDIPFAKDKWMSRARLCFAALRELAVARSLFPMSYRGIVGACKAAWIASAIRSQLERWKPDWIHSHFLGLPAAAGSLLASRMGVSISISAHARDVFVPTLRPAAVCGQARFVAACSEHARASLAERLPSTLAERVVYFPHHLTCEATVRKIDTVQNGPLRLLSVCRLVPKKGIDVVLRALALLKSDVDYIYRVVGDGPEMRRLQALALKLGLKRIVFTGLLSPEEVPGELASADIFILGCCSAPDGDRDGIPNAILEAMAAGVPVVVTDGGAVSEVIQHRRTGWLTPQNEPQALAQALLEAASDPVARQKISTNAHGEVRRRFSTQRNSGQLARRLAAELDVVQRS